MVVRRVRGGLVLRGTGVSHIFELDFYALPDLAATILAHMHSSCKNNSGWKRRESPVSFDCSAGRGHDVRQVQPFLFAMASIEGLRARLLYEAWR